MAQATAGFQRADVFSDLSPTSTSPPPPPPPQTDGPRQRPEAQVRQGRWRYHRGFGEPTSLTIGLLGARPRHAQGTALWAGAGAGMRSRMRWERCPSSVAPGIAAPAQPATNAAEDAGVDQDMEPIDMSDHCAGGTTPPPGRDGPCATSSRPRPCTVPRLLLPRSMQ